MTQITAKLYGLDPTYDARQAIRMLVGPGYIENKLSIAIDLRERYLEWHDLKTTRLRKRTKQPSNLGAVWGDLYIRWELDK